MENCLDNETTWNCTICNVVVASKQNLENHILFAHDGKTPAFKCSICDKTFDSENTLKEHLISIDCEEVSLNDLLQFESRNPTVSVHDGKKLPQKIGFESNENVSIIEKNTLSDPNVKEQMNNDILNHKNSRFCIENSVIPIYEKERSIEISENPKNGQFVHERKKLLSDSMLNDCEEIVFEISKNALYLNEEIASSKDTKFITKKSKRVSQELHRPLRNREFIGNTNFVPKNRLCNDIVAKPIFSTLESSNDNQIVYSWVIVI